jgi:hypothetical protein
MREKRHIKFNIAPQLCYENKVSKSHHFSDMIGIKVQPSSPLPYPPLALAFSLCALPPTGFVFVCESVNVERSIHFVGLLGHVFGGLEVDWWQLE